MGYDIEWQVVPPELRGKAEGALDRTVTDAPAIGAFQALYCTLESFGFYHRESNAGMYVMLGEMRHQGAGELADLIDLSSPKCQRQIPPDVIEVALGILSDTPTGPPDLHGFTSPFQLDHSGHASGGVRSGVQDTDELAADIVLISDEDAWATLAWATWLQEWREWLAFLGRAARQGGGISVA